jgi:hypothetical protein
MPIRQGGKELEHLPSPDLAPDQHLARGADAVHLEDGLGDIQTTIVVTALMGCSCVAGCAKQPCYLTAGWEPSTASF